MDFYTIKIMEAIDWAKGLPVDILAKEVNRVLADGSQESTAIVIDAATNRLIVGCRQVNDQQAKYAARYQWLRTPEARNQMMQDSGVDNFEDSDPAPEFDARIDAAMQAKGE